MTGAQVLEATAKYIPSTAEGLDLALDVEEAMPEVRCVLIKAVLDDLSAFLTQHFDELPPPHTNWRIQCNWTDDHKIMDKYSRMTLQRDNWGGGHKRSHGVSIQTDFPGWRWVCLGVSFHDKCEKTCQDLRSAAKPIIDNSKEDEGWPAWLSLERLRLGVPLDWSQRDFITKAGYPALRQPGDTSTRALGMAMLDLARRIAPILDKYAKARNGGTDIP